MEETTINDKTKHRREMQKLYYEKNKEAIALRQKQFYLLNKDVIIKKVVERNKANPQQKKDQFKKRYHENREKHLQEAKTNYIKYKEHITTRENTRRAVRKQQKEETQEEDAQTS